MSLSHLPAGQRRKKERGARRWSNHTEASAWRKAHAARRRVRTRRCTRGREQARTPPPARSAPSRTNNANRRHVRREATHGDRSVHTHRPPTQPPKALGQKAQSTDPPREGEAHTASKPDDFIEAHTAGKPDDFIEAHTAGKPGDIERPTPTTAALVAALKLSAAGNMHINPSARRSTAARSRTRGAAAAETDASTTMNNDGRDAPVARSRLTAGGPPLRIRGRTCCQTYRGQRRHRCISDS